MTMEIDEISNQINSQVETQLAPQRIKKGTAKSLKQFDQGSRPFSKMTRTTAASINNTKMGHTSYRQNESLKATSK